MEAAHCLLTVSQLLFVLLMAQVTMTPDVIPRVILVTVGMLVVTLAWPAAAFQPFISVDQEVRIIWDQTKTITR